MWVMTVVSIVRDADDKVYRELVGQFAYVDSPRALVMMSPTIHSLYDQHKLSLYPLPTSPGSDEIWVVNYFCPPLGSSMFDIAHRLLHGRQIVVSKQGDLGSRPDWRLAKWHYTQTVRFRFGPPVAGDSSPGTTPKLTPRKKTPTQGTKKSPTTPKARP